MKMSFAANNALLKALALLLLFIIMGTAYAMWSEVLKVNAIVNTGEVDAEIVRAYTPDSVPGILDYNGRPTTWPSPEDFVFNPGYGWVAVIAGDIEYWETDKDVAYADTWLEDSDGDGDTDTVYVKMHNAYPGYMIWLSLEVDNVGTIPIFIDYYIVNGTTLTDEQIERNNLVFLDADGAVSYTHLRAPRDRQKSRMPSSA